MCQPSECRNARTGLHDRPGTLAQDSGALRGRRMSAGGRRDLRQALFQAALTASLHNPTLTTAAQPLRDKEKPHNVVIIIIAARLVAIAKSRQKWNAAAGKKHSCWHVPSKQKLKDMHATAPGEWRLFLSGGSPFRLRLPPKGPGSFPPGRLNRAAPDVRRSCR
ncbi:transposase [Falsigemmobacter faecalis]|uniref:transposase n=1 Tax=Falsigemmobacter faecalis TaxID=2488730 RepID=UPI0038990CD1